MTLDSQWDEQEALQFVERYGPAHGEDVAIRVYSSRLLGLEPSLVLHGGGNTSVKSVFRNALGEELPAIFVKGSGWDLATLEPAGLPGLDLNYLRRLRDLSSLPDDVMVNELRTHLFDASAPTPSVETLLHAFLPHKFIDHSHADLIVALTNSRDAEGLLAECFGNDVAYVPYVMPGFELSKVATACFEKTPSCEALVLLKHGLFTFGATAKASYENHLRIVNRAAQFLAKQKKSRKTTQISLSQNLSANPLLPAIRGALARGASSTKGSAHWILSVDQTPELLAELAQPDAREIFETGPLTPDHILRTKELPLFLTIPQGSDLAQLQTVIDSALGEYRATYENYFERMSTLRNVTRTRLDSNPRVLLIPNFGVVSVGETKKAAKIAADISEHTISTKGLVSNFSKYESLGQADLFDVEYWGLEQAKLLLSKPKQLAGRVVFISGGTGAIGLGIAKTLAAAGAEVAIGDIRESAATAKRLGVFGVDCDVRSDESVTSAIEAVVREFGGIDILVPNAGIAYSAPISKLDSARVAETLDVNYMGAMRLLRETAKIFETQGTGGHVILISSKNVFAPGREFSAYSASKAALHQLGKIAALELAPLGVKVNMINPDAVFASGDQPSGLWKEVGPGRAKAHGISFDNLEEHYRQRNLLKTRITAEDVGRAVLFFASDQTPTTGATLPVDGGIAEAFPR